MPMSDVTFGEVKDAIVDANNEWTLEEVLRSIDGKRARRSCPTKNFIAPAGA